MRETFYTVPGCPVRVALVTDLHERPYARVLESLRKNRPNLICAAGDFLYAKPVRGRIKVEAAGVLPFFRAAAALAPCYVSLGNHEWMVTEEDLQLLRETGAHPLDNAWETVTRKGAQLVLGGLSSGRVSACRRLREAGLTMEAAAAKKDILEHSPPVLDWLDAYCAAPGYHILLCHHPEYYPRYLKARGIELILSGHAHGGQIRLFGQGLYAPGQGLFPKLTSGVTDGRLAVSRGLANCQLVPRLFNPTEIVYIG